MCYPSTKVYVPIAKIERYLLNEKMEHYQNFELAGYKSGDGYRLFRELERCYDKSKAFDFIYGIGYSQYSILVVLGEYTFRTVWREDNISPLPRFVTAYIDRRVSHE